MKTKVIFISKAVKKVQHQEQKRIAVCHGMLVIDLKPLGKVTEFKMQNFMNEESKTELSYKSGGR